MRVRACLYSPRTAGSVSSSRVGSGRCATWLLWGLNEGLCFVACACLPSTTWPAAKANIKSAKKKNRGELPCPLPLIESALLPCGVAAVSSTGPPGSSFCLSGGRCIERYARWPSLPLYIRVRVCWRFFLSLRGLETSRSHETHTSLLALSLSLSLSTCLFLLLLRQPRHRL